MKNQIRILRVFLYILLSFIINSCKEKPTPPSITTTDVTEITQTNAKSGGVVTEEGGAPVVSRGVCWNISVDPTITNSITIDDEGLGTFTSKITKLTPNTKYYVRAYGTNSAGTSYGNQVSFTTIQVAAPSLTTVEIASITQTTAVSGGIITDDKGAPVTARGVCYGIAANPTISGSKTTDGTGSDSFVSYLTGLIGNTTYYVRSYATNSVGTGYGNEISFKTSPVLPSISTATISSISAYTATSGGNITNDGGATVTVRGVCWSTSANPTIALSTKTADGTGNGVFTSSISGLSPGETYYVRAYATNIVGTVYGSQVTFTSVIWPNVETLAPSNITQTGFTVGGNVFSDGGGQITERGVLYSTSPDLTLISGTALTQVAPSTNNPFTCNLTGLTPNTVYYVVAYAKNVAGISSSISFKVKTYTGTVNDIEGNIYNTETLGTQIWMVENLKTTKYKDGTAIPLVTDVNAWTNLITPGYCWQNNDASTYKNAYGALYNWYTVNTGKLCPAGWHVPTDTEWHAMILFIDPSALLSETESLLAGGKIKEFGINHWHYPNPHSYEIGWFTSLPGGSFYQSFQQVAYYGSWWSSTEDPQGWSQYAFLRSMRYDKSEVYRVSDMKQLGISVRCLKDN
jgi:uncharacterized protein (TIGR02145 family)